MGSFIENLTSINDSINTVVWTKIVVWLLIAVGVIMTTLTGFFQVTHIGHWMKKTVGSIFDSKVKGHTGEKASISQFQALCTALAATVGVGNIAGVAAAITLVKELKEQNIPHGKIEMVFTRDEENGLTGANNLDFSQFESEYVIVIDADKTGDVLTSGASFVKLNLAVNTYKGGHSGNDIDDKTRLNAVKLIAELMNDIPQGVYYKNKSGVITSINAGAIIGGGVENSIKDFHSEKEIIEHAMTNLINTDAYAIYSLRSADRKKEEELINKVRKIVDKFNKKYDGFA